MLLLLLTTTTTTLLSIPTIIWLLLYLIPQIYMGYIRSVPNLKHKYGGSTATTTTRWSAGNNSSRRSNHNNNNNNCDDDDDDRGDENNNNNNNNNKDKNTDTCCWAVVTGGGSGIGKSIVFRLASQGINVIVISLDDEYLVRTMNELQSSYPTLQFRSLGITFARNVDYMNEIIQRTKDILQYVRIIFCNAGYIVTGYTDQVPMDKLMANIECNTISAVQISHYFIQNLVTLKRTGCVVFTSSVAAYIPTPFAIIYSSTKAFISQYAASLHIECKPLGIDVCAIHPSPIASNFYNQLDHKVDLIEQAAQNAMKPDDIVNDIFCSIGVCAYRDIGTLACFTRMGTFFIPYNAFTELFTIVAPYLPDWKRHNQHRT